MGSAKEELMIMPVIANDRPRVDVPAVADSTRSSRLLSRMRAEFVEMPGLQVTPGQAAKVFGIDAGLASRLLGVLAEEGFLSRGGRGVFSR